MVAITPSITLREDEFQLDFIRASGPGGQNVNKVATAVQLRFDVRRSPSLPDGVRERLEKLAGSRLTQEGVLMIEAKRYRTQEQNRLDAIKRLVTLIQKAVEEPKPRQKTRPSRAAKQARVEEKKKRGEVKKTRRQSPWED
jgi:ribosome-associated protein